jgi:beta-barrel assembly-enhancing protease
MHNVDYFDGVNPGNQLVSLYCNELGVSILSLNDPSQVIAFSKYANCNLYIMHQKMVVYLNKKSNQFIIVYADSSFYYTLKTNIEKATLPWYKKMIKFKTAWLLSILIGFIVAIYLIAVYLIPVFAIRFISKKNEIAIGDKLNAAFVSEQKIDQQRTKWINAFSKELHLNTSYPIKIKVIEAKEVNAFALPGGFIIVYSGILENMHSSEELVALLSHETAHVNLRHSLKSMLGSTAAGLLISMVLSDASGTIGALVENADFLRTMHYSRQLERAADEEGMKILLRNQINPMAMHQLMIDLKESNKELPASMAFLSSHPTTDERINNAKAFAKRYKDQTFSSKQSLDSIWLQLKY